MKVAGCDPGAFGAIAIVDTDDSSLILIDMPTIKVKRGPRLVNQVDATALAEALRLYAPDVSHAYIEKTWSVTGQGVSSSFAFGRAGGVLEGVWAGLGVSISLVPPQTWTKAMRRFSGKDASRERAIEFFPEYAKMFSRKKDDGRADAALIAMWGIQNADEARGEIAGRRKGKR
jgi:crossover junction endodeoxyribonuclease RuvC